MTGAVGSVGVVDVVVGVALVTAAVVALTVRDRLASVITFVLFGVLLGVTWAGLSSPDVVLAEAALGTGVTSAFFIDAVIRHRASPSDPGADPRSAPPGFSRGRLALAVSTGVLGLAFAALATRALVTAGADPVAPPLVDTIDEAMPDTATDHPITAVLLDFRAYDTFLEVVVVLAAVIGAFAIAAVSGATNSGDAPTDPLAVDAADRMPRGESEHVRVPARPETYDDFIRLATPLLLLIAMWVLFAGTYRPGGAFQAAAVLTGIGVLGVAWGWPARPFRGAAGRWVVIAGAALFLIAAALGRLTTGDWFAMPEGWESAATIAVETALAFSLGAGLTMLFLAVRRGRAVIGDGPATARNGPATARNGSATAQNGAPL